MEYPLTTATACFVLALFIARALFGGRRESQRARDLRRHYMRKGR